MANAHFDLQKLSRHIGAEIKGIDLGQKHDGAVTNDLRRAFLDNSVLLFRDQKLSQDDLLRITGYFGTLAKLTRPAKFFPKGYSKLLPNIMMISNIRENGETIGALPDGEMNFHHDQIHSEIPHNATLLYSLEIPSYGGDTLFASGYAAYDTLDAELKTAIEGKKAHNFYNYGSTLRGKGGVEAHSEAVHPVVRTHEETGRKALYVNRLMTRTIQGMPEAESDRLLDRLFEHSEKPEFVYRHQWRIGDLLIWDNRCSTHAREDFPADQRRLMLRTTVEGTVRPY